MDRFITYEQFKIPAGDAFRIEVHFGDLERETIRVDRPRRETHVQMGLRVFSKSSTDAALECVAEYWAGFYFSPKRADQIAEWLSSVEQVSETMVMDDFLEALEIFLAEECTELLPGKIGYAEVAEDAPASEPTNSPDPIMHSQVTPTAKPQSAPQSDYAIPQLWEASPAIHNHLNASEPNFRNCSNGLTPPKSVSSDQPKPSDLPQAVSLCATGGRAPKIGLLRYLPLLVLVAIALIFGGKTGIIAVIGFTGVAVVFAAIVFACKATYFAGRWSIENATGIITTILKVLGFLLFWIVMVSLCNSCPGTIRP